MNRKQQKAYWAKRKANSSQPDANKKTYFVRGHLDIPLVGGIEAGYEVEQLRLKKTKMFQDKDREDTTRQFLKTV